MHTKSKASDVDKSYVCVCVCVCVCVYVCNAVLFATDNGGSCNPKIRHKENKNYFFTFSLCANCAIQSTKQWLAYLTYLTQEAVTIIMGRVRVLLGD